MTDLPPEGASGPEALPADPLVSTMLRKLPVPEHRPGFWSALEARLAEPAAQAEPAAATGSAAGAVGTHSPASNADGQDEASAVVVAASRRAARRRSSPPLAALAAVAAVVVVVAGATLLRNRGDTANLEAVAGQQQGRQEAVDAGSAGPTAGGGAPEDPLWAGPFTGTTAPPEGTPARPGDLEAALGEPASPEEAATTFVALIAAGDSARAWELLDERSRQHWGDEARFSAAGPELARSLFGAMRWARGLDVSQIVLASSAERELGVVVLDGVVELAGDAARRVLELPYRWDGGQGAYRLDPWGAVGATAEVRFRWDGGESAGGSDEVVEVGPRASVTISGLDWSGSGVLTVDGVQVAVEASRDGVTFTPPAPWAPGVHRLSVAALVDGAVVAESALFRAR